MKKKEKCEHEWRFMYRGFYNPTDEEGEFEVYYCIKCLTSTIVEFLNGKRTITGIDKVKETK